MNGVTKRPPRTSFQFDFDSNINVLRYIYDKFKEKHKQEMRSKNKIALTRVTQSNYFVFDDAMTQNFNEK